MASLAGLLVLLSMAACQQKATDSKSEGKPGAKPAAMLHPDSIAKGSIVFVNTDTLLANYEWFKKQKADLEARSKSLEAQMEGKARSFQGEVQQAREKAQKELMTQAQMQAAEQRLMGRQQELTAFRDEQVGKLADEEKRLNKELSKKVQDFTKAFAKEHGYSYVLGYTDPGGILYGDERLDITPAVLEGLNKAYAEETKK
jgi:outer membrane protein